MCSLGKGVKSRQAAVTAGDVQPRAPSFRYLPLGQFITKKNHILLRPRSPAS